MHLASHCRTTEYLNLYRALIGYYNSFSNAAGLCFAYGSHLKEILKNK